MVETHRNTSSYLYCLRRYVFIKNFWYTYYFLLYNIIHFLLFILSQLTFSNKRYISELLADYTYYFYYIISVIIFLLNFMHDSYDLYLCICTLITNVVWLRCIAGYISCFEAIQSQVDWSYGKNGMFHHSITNPLIFRSKQPNIFWTQSVRRFSLEKDTFNYCLRGVYQMSKT